MPDTADKGDELEDILDGLQAATMTVWDKTRGMLPTDDFKRLRLNAKADIEAYCQRREVAARVDELGRAAPHQVAQYFEIPSSELNSSWYLSYCLNRRDELEGQLNSEGKQDD
jgi:hypothetical protein